MQLRDDLAPMGRTLRLFCRAVLLLEYIPSYRRYYTIDLEADTLKTSERHWRWSRRGLWGMYLLMRMNLFWRYIDLEDPWPDSDLSHLDP